MAYELLDVPGLSALPAGERALALIPPVRRPYRPTAVWTRALRLSAGAAATPRTLSDPDGDRTAYLQLRDTLETILPTAVTSLAYEQTHVKGLRLRFGVGHQVYQRRAVFAGPVIREQTTRQVLDATTGDVLRVDSIARNYRTRSTRGNVHQTLAVSLGAGYVLPTSTRWRPYVLAEAGYEFLVATRGSLFDARGMEIPLDNAAETWVNPSPGLRFGGTLGVDVALTNRWQVGLSGNFVKHGGLTGEADVLTSDAQSFGGALNVTFGL